MARKKKKKNRPLGAGTQRTETPGPGTNREPSNSSAREAAEKGRKNTPEQDGSEPRALQLAAIRFGVSGRRRSHIQVTNAYRIVTAYGRFGKVEEQGVTQLAENTTAEIRKLLKEQPGNKSTGGEKKTNGQPLAMVTGKREKSWML